MEYSRNSASILPYFFAKKKQGIHQAVSLSSKKPTANTLFERYKSKMTIFPKICRKMWSNQETSVRKQVKKLCEVVAYAMRSSGKTSLAVGLSPYKIAKKDVLASKLAGRFFHHFAWLVAFTKSSQKN